MKLSSDTALVYIITHMELGGAQKVCLSLCSGFKSHQLHTYLITGRQGILADQINGPFKTIFLDSLKREVGIKALLQEIKTFFSLIKMLRTLRKQHKKVIVHTHCTKAGILGRWAAWIAGIKVRIHTIHGYAFHDHQSRIKWLLHYLPELLTSFITTHFVCVSAADAKTGIALFPRFSRKHSIIRAAIAWEQFYIPARKPESDSPSEHFIFGSISCFKEQKNLFDLLSAFKMVHDACPVARLEIIGDGILRPALQTWIKEHNVSDYVTLHGWQNNVVPFMLNWKAFVLSSLWEGLPCAVVEARMLKLPVLAYNTGGINEVITPGANGFLYPQKEWKQLAQGMITLIQSPQLHQKLQSYSDNLADFNDHSMIQSHHKLYKRLNHH